MPTNNKEDHPGHPPKQNLTFLTTVATLKYGGLALMAAALNKWDVVTIQTLNTTTTIGSSAGAGLSASLQTAGKAVTGATLFATAVDVAHHAGCEPQAGLPPPEVLWK